MKKPKMGKVPKGATGPEKMPRAPRAKTISPPKIGQAGKPMPVSPLKKKEFEY